MRRVWVGVLGAVLLLVTSACRVDTSVGIVVSADGSGEVVVTVETDAEAAAELVDSPSDLNFSDLSDAGWRVESAELDGGGLSLTVSKPFASASELPTVLDEVFGPGLVFREVALHRDHDFSLIGIDPAKATYELTATIDATPDLESLGDQELAALLGGSPLGRSLLQAETDAGGSFESALGLTVAVELPGPALSDSATVVDNTATWTFRYGDEVAVVDASASSDAFLPRVWALVAEIAALLLALVLLSRLGSWLVARARAPKGRRRRDQRQRQERAATREAEASRPRRRLLRLLIVDVHGVLVTPADPAKDLLVPMVARLRPDVDPDQVRELHRRLTLGRISPEEFWQGVDLSEERDEIETRYLSSFRLVPGLHTFLGRMASSRLPVSAVGNQPRAWGDRLRRMASLEGVLSSWLVSGEVGARLPDPGLFEATRRTMSVDLYDCFYLSNRAEHLDAAQELGLATGLFIPEGDVPDGTEHLVVRGFDDLLRNRGS